MSDIASLNSENALLKQQLVHAQAEKSLQQSLLAAQRVALAAKDGEVQALRALASLGIACGSAGATPGSTSASSRDEQRKCARVVDDSSLRSPLDKDELLDTGFSYVGVDDYLFAAGVCRRWRGRYIKLCYNKAALAVKVDKLRTSFKSAIVTAARLHLALTGSNSLTIAELQANDNTLAKQITRYALDPIAVLTLARVRELTWTTWLCEGAACNNKLELLKWLRESGCPWEEVPVCTGATRSGHVDLLQWLQQNTTAWSDGFKDALLCLACWSDQLTAAKWLRQQGAQWPVRFYCLEICESRLRNV